MTEKPIIFSASMVRAIMDGRKYQTRRLLGRLRRFGAITEFGKSDTKGYDWTFRDKGMRWNDLRHRELLDYLPFKVGDMLWVREGWGWSENASMTPSPEYPQFLRYRSTDVAIAVEWRSPIHMPRWASRVTLKVSAVKVERLHDITHEDALAEGVRWTGTSYYVKDGTFFHTASKAFQSLWASIHGPSSWEANQFVTVITLEMVN